MSLILMTRLFYKALLLQGEIWCWSLLGFKGFITTIDRKSKLVDAKNMIYMWGRYVLWWLKYTLSWHPAVYRERRQSFTCIWKEGFFLM